MFQPGDAQYLKQKLSANDVVLFLGAGFSADATNRLGQPMPLSRAASEKMWDFLGYPGGYDGTPLPDMYEAVLQSGIPQVRIRDFLESHFLTRSVPAEYENLVPIYWYRIYTTNIDDVLKQAYRNQRDLRLQVVAYPRDEPKERDQALEAMQVVYLHGILPGDPQDITFSVRQYARRANEISPLYQQFVGDYATHPTVFIGTELNEPLFWQHIEAREKRVADISEQRPKSFLISPHISPPKRAQLKAFNVVPVEGTGRDFLTWLEQLRPELPSREGVLRVTLPSVVALLNQVDDAPRQKSLQEFGKAFHLIPTSMDIRGDRSFFLLGATPRWEDLFRNLDAPRDITTAVLTHLEGVLDGSEKVRVLALIGSAGSGKSTILRRLGIRLAQGGRAAFLTNSEEIPDPKVISDALRALNRPAALLFDNAEVAMWTMASIAEATAHLEHPVALVIAARANEFDRRSSRLEQVADVREFLLSSLSRAEIVNLIRILDENSLLGHLQGMRPRDRIREFEEGADRQILVAMREATSGRGFDEIIQDEFDRLPSVELKLLYLCVALATDAGYRITKQQFVGCSRVSPAETLHLLDRNLKGIVIGTGPRKDLLLLRHRTIAEYVLDRFGPRTLIGDAYVRLLTVLARDVPGAGRGSRTFGLYRELSNHRKIYERFASQIEDARGIYDSVSGLLSSDAHFWLQYGLLELEFGNIELAENYLKQAESLYPESFMIQNSIGHLSLTKAMRATSASDAYQLREDGSAILLSQMDISDTPYPYHIYCSQRLGWAQLWIKDRDTYKQELEHLRAVIKRGRELYGRNRKLRMLQEEIEREYFSLAIR